MDHRQVRNQVPDTKASRPQMLFLEPALPPSLLENSSGCTMAPSPSALPHSCLGQKASACEPLGLEQSKGLRRRGPGGSARCPQHRDSRATRNDKLPTSERRNILNWQERGAAADTPNFKLRKPTGWRPSGKK